MSGWAARRFWAEARAVPEAAGFGVRLDGRAVRTPAKAPLVLPTLALAEAVAAEWQAQDGTIRPETMPFTRTANAAIDKVAPQTPAVVAELARYGETDLLCHRAPAPAALAARQAAAWDPLLGWAAEVLAAPLNPTVGVLPRAQPADSLKRLAAEVGRQDAFRLAALHDLVAIPGSLVLGLAVIRGRMTPGDAWSAARIDEDWQTEHWGEDEEAAAADAVRRAAFLHAARFHALCD
ncbi:MAG: ATP12 family protein [Gemmobacter sp.]